MLWFDTTIFVLTFVKAIRMRSEISGGLLETMFRDGTFIPADDLLCIHVHSLYSFKVPSTTREQMKAGAHDEQKLMAAGIVIAVFSSP